MGKLLTTEEVAQVLSVAPGTVENWRYKQEGPPYVKLGNRRNSPVRYREMDMKTYLDSLQSAA